MTDNTIKVFPYSDDYMRFDELSGRYVLTEAALEAGGIFLRARLSRSPMINADAVIGGLCETATNHVYSYVHKFSHDNYRQDVYLAKIPSLRPIIYKALVEQVKYVYFGGDRTLSRDKDEQALYMAPLAIDALNTTAPELGASILYTGGY